MGPEEGDGGSSGPPPGSPVDMSDPRSASLTARPMVTPRRPSCPVNVGCRTVPSRPGDGSVTRSKSPKGPTFLGS